MTPKTVFVYGDYAVVVSTDGYIVRNTSTGVDEHSSRVLYEAIRYAKIFEASVREAINTPVEDDWGKPTVEGQMEMEFNGRPN